jgi:3-oxoadipate enol-lactonase
MSTYVSRGLQLSYEEVGTGRPLVLLHGISNFGLSWAPQLGLLTSLGWRVVFPDFAGHGRSAPVTAPTTSHELATDVVALLDHLRLDRAVVCGLSLGGMVTQQLLVDYAARIAGAIVAAFRPDFTFPGAAAQIAGWQELWRSDNGPIRRLEATWPQLTTEAYRASPHGQAFYATWRQVLAGVSGQALAYIADGVLTFNVVADLPQVRAPVLVLAAEHDRLMPPEQVHAVAGLVPGARVATIPAAGHLMYLEQPARFNALLAEFLAGAPS